MNAFKCDRCKKYYDYYPGVTINKINHDYNAVKTIFVSKNNQVICSKGYEPYQDCMIKIINFLEGDESVNEY